MNNLVLIFSLFFHQIDNRFIECFSISACICMKTVDAGYFATTPFFISFCDRAVQQRSAYYSYLLALAYRYTGDTKLAQKYIEQAAVSDPYALNIFAERQF